MKNLKHVFSFTFIQKVRQKGYITATVLLAVLFLILPAAIMVIADNVGEDAPPTVKTETVFVYDSTDGDADYSVLSPDKKITYQMADTLEDALKAAEKVPYALVLQVEKDKLALLLPENSLATKEEAEVLSAEIKGLFPLILAQKAGISQEQLLGLSTPSEIITPSGETSPEEQSEQLRQIIAMVAPMLVLFLMYFMVLLYGQSTANSAIMEKSSKLMDTFLLSVKPETMMLGKVFATALAGILQTLLWLGSLMGGFFLGKEIVLALNPESDLAILSILSSMKELGEVIDLPGLAVGLLVIVAGLFLYCSLAAIGGALASKQEDLAQTNYIFTLTLVLSFVLSLDEGSMTSGVKWLYYFPFTAILTLPGSAAVGNVSIPEALLCLGIILVTTVIITVISGKIYRLMAFYKGNPPKITKIFELLKTKNR